MTRVSPTLRRIRRAAARFRSPDGAVDLASIMVGILVLGIVAGIIVATVFGVIPWSQDNAAQQSLDAVKTAESVSRAQTSRYVTMPQLVSASLTQKSTSVNVGTDLNGTCFLSVSGSPTGHVYWSSDKNPTPHLYTQGTSETDPAWCATTSSSSFLVGTASGAAPPVSAARLRFGVANPNGPQATSELTGIAKLVGESPSMIQFYDDFTVASPTADLNAAVAQGATPIVTWEPWNSANGVTQPAYSLAAIAGGSQDSYLHSWAAAIKAFGQPVMIRFAHEMNGNWYPWDEGVNGNAPGDFVKAWKHVHDLFAADGATNAQWLWSPDIPYTGSTDLTELFPGTGYVDAVSLDGFNWGTSQVWSSWTSPSGLFSPGLTQLRALAPGKPIYISEVASSEVGGDKAGWNSALVSYLDAQPDIAGFVWFDFNKETDWRIDSSTGSSAAIKNALAGR